MKLMAYTLLDIDEYLQQENTNRVTVRSFAAFIRRSGWMIQQLALLETMSPKDYQEIRSRSWATAAGKSRLVFACS